MRSYSYYIEVSMDQRDWVRVVDHSNYHCRSWQRLYFPQRVARFIRVVGKFKRKHKFQQLRKISSFRFNSGTHNTVNKVFHCVALEAYYSPTIVRLEKELIGTKKTVLFLIEQSSESVILSCCL
jgi:BTB/POZ domain-containing protein 9